MSVATPSATALPSAAPQNGLVDVLSGLVTTLGQLVQLLQGQAGGQVQGGGPGGAKSGAQQVQQDPSQAASLAKPGGCGCGAGKDALAGAGEVTQSDPAVGKGKGKSKGKGTQLQDSGAGTPPPPPGADSGGTPPGAPKTDLHPKKDQKQIDAFLDFAGKTYGTKASLLHQIALKESGFDETAVNHTDSNAQAGHPSEGMFQFIPTTFDSFAAKAKAANPKAWEGLGPLNIKDWRQQALATSWAIQNGHSGDWATFGAASAAA